MPVEPRLTVERLLTSSDGTLVPLRLAVDRLDVHEEVVSDAEATPTFLAQIWGLLRVALDVPSELVGRGKSPGATVKWTLMLQFGVSGIGRLWMSPARL